jgi:hypothetical protein
MVGSEWILGILIWLSMPLCFLCNIFILLLLWTNLYCYHEFKSPSSDIHCRRLARVSPPDRACTVQRSALTASTSVRSLARWKCKVGRMRLAGRSLDSPDLYDKIFSPSATDPQIRFYEMEWLLYRI